MDVAGEHVVSATLHRRAGGRDGGCTGPARATRRRGPARGSHHELGILAFAVLLRRAGVEVVYLGADLPAQHWVRSSSSTTPPRSSSGSRRATDVLAVRETVAALHAARPRLAVHVGGGAQFEVGQGTVPLGSHGVGRGPDPGRRAAHRRRRPRRPPAGAHPSATTAPNVRWVTSATIGAQLAWPPARVGSRCPRPLKESAMSDTSRRIFLAAAGSSAAAAAAVVAAPGALAAPSTSRPDAADPDGQPLVAYIDDVTTGRVSILFGEDEVVVAGRRPGRPPHPGREEVTHVLTPRSARDLQGPGRRQHRRLRVRQPRQARHRHADRQLHPVPEPAGRPELLRVRRRRAVRDPRQQQRRRPTPTSPTSSGSPPRSATTRRSSTTPDRSPRSATRPGTVRSPTR